MAWLARYLKVKILEGEGVVFSIGLRLKDIKLPFLFNKY